MTIKQLISKLNKYNLDTEIKCESLNDNGDWESKDFRLVKSYFNPERNHLLISPYIE